MKGRMDIESPIISAICRKSCPFFMAIVYGDRLQGALPVLLFDKKTNDQAGKNVHKKDNEEGTLTKIA